MSGTSLPELQAKLLSTSKQDLHSTTTTTKTATKFLLPLGAAAPNMMAFETTFRPASKAVGASSMPNLPAMLACLMLLLQTYLALANPANAAAAASALFPGYRTVSSPSPMARRSSSSSSSRNQDYARNGHDKHNKIMTHNNHDDDDDDNILLPRQQRQQSVDSTCDGSEGQWNCMNTSWQRCAAGRWSGVVQMADGTRCRPEGLTWNFAIENGREQGGGNGGGRATSSAIPGTGWGLKGGVEGRGRGGGGAGGARLGGGGGGAGGGRLGGGIVGGRLSYSLSDWSLVFFGGFGFVVGGWV